MEMTGEQRIAAPRQTVWEALNDPDVLKQCIPGCQHIERSGENEFTAKVRAKVGPVNAMFSGKVTLSDLNPPESYTISGQGTGGAAGFAKGGADVKLEDEGEVTLLKYKANAQVGGKLAQLGQRLIQSTADKYAKEFFETFDKVVAGDEAAAVPVSEAEAQPGEIAASERAPATQGRPTSEAEAQPAGAPSSAENRAAAESGEAAEAAAGREGRGQESGAAVREGAEARPDEPVPAAPSTADKTTFGGLSPKVWITGVIAIVVIILLLFVL